MNRLYVCETFGIIAGLPESTEGKISSTAWELTRLCGNCVGPVHTTPKTLEWLASNHGMPSPFPDGMPDNCDEVMFLGFKIIFDDGLTNGVMYYDENWTERNKPPHIQ